MTTSVIYPGLMMTRIFEREEFVVHHMQGNEAMPFPTFSSSYPDGSSMNDAMSISDKPACVSSFRGSRIVPAWEDAGKGFMRGGGKTWIWDEPYNYWCISDWRRPRNEWIIEGDIHYVKAKVQKGIKVKKGEHLALLTGKAIIDGETHYGFWIKEDFPHSTTKVVNARSDCGFVVIKPVPVKK